MHLYKPLHIPWLHNLQALKLALYQQRLAFYTLSVILSTKETAKKLPAIMSKRLVGIRHPMRVLTLLHCGTAVIVCIR